MTPRRKQLRAAVHERDRGICAECHLDCDALQQRYIQAEIVDESHPEYICPRCGGVHEDSGPCQFCGWTRGLRRKPAPDARRAIEQELANLGYSIPWIMRLRSNGARGVAFWEADHSSPIGEEGPDTIDNLVSLCIPHHQQKTAGQANRRRIANESRKRKDRKRHRKDCRKLSWLNEGPCTCGKDMNGTRS